MQPLRSRLTVVPLTLLIVASCGGGGGPSRAEHPGRHGSGDSASEWGSSGGSGAPAPSNPCRDETCFECGDGICPTGYYCDETTEPACGWIPACATSPDCACISAGLGATCECEVRDGGLFVSCE